MLRFSMNKLAGEHFSYYMHLDVKYEYINFLR
jgi:hypothetical protein